MVNLPPISVCIATKNEAATIERCLQSVEPIADEIVILDSYSDDGTLEICKEYGCNIYQEEFEGFAILFSSLIEKATNDWVFIIDADEALSKELSQEIRMKLTSDDHTVAYMIWKKNKMYGEWMHVKHKFRPQLAKKEYLEFTEGYIHEEWIIREKSTNQIEWLKNPILHWTYPRVSDHFHTVDRYTSLEALKAYERSPWYRPSMLYFPLKAIGAMFYMLFKERAILDGYHGLMFSFLTFIYFFCIPLKINDIERLAEERPQQWRELWLTEECS